MTTFVSTSNMTTSQQRKVLKFKKALDETRSMFNDSDVRGFSFESLINSSISELDELVKIIKKVKLRVKIIDKFVAEGILTEDPVVDPSLVNEALLAQLNEKYPGQAAHRLKFSHENSDKRARVIIGENREIFDQHLSAGVSATIKKFYDDIDMSKMLVTSQLIQESDARSFDAPKDIPNCRNCKVLQDIVESYQVASHADLDAEDLKVKRDIRREAARIAAAKAKEIAEATARALAMIDANGGDDEDYADSLSLAEFEAVSIAEVAKDREDSAGKMDRASASEIESISNRVRQLVWRDLISDMMRVTMENKDEVAAVAKKMTRKLTSRPRGRTLRVTAWGSQNPKLMKNIVAQLCDEVVKSIVADTQGEVEY